MKKDHKPKIKQWKPKTSQEKLALKLTKILKEKGHKHTYIVGGYVRDYFLKKKDTGAIDIATQASPQQVTRIFRNKKYSVIPTGIKHGTVTVHQGACDIEITTFRTEGKYADFRRPKNVKFIDDPLMDARRRDFTINAMYLDPVTGELLDFFDGQADLKKKVLRFVGTAEKRIKEDALRLMRAVRFTSALELRIGARDLATIRKNARLIKEISPERVKQELDKMLVSSRPSVGFGTLDVVGLTEQILPELRALQGVTQPRNMHTEGDAYAHSLLALEKMKGSYDLPTRYAVLLHDIGKAKTRLLRDGRITFYNHQNFGEELTKKICDRLKFSRQESDKITWLVRNHMVPFDVTGMKLSTKRKWALHPHFPDLLKVYLADNAASLRPSPSAWQGFRPPHFAPAPRA